MGVRGATFGPRCALGPPTCGQLHQGPAWGDKGGCWGGGQPERLLPTQSSNRLPQSLGPDSGSGRPQGDCEPKWPPGLSQALTTAPGPQPSARPGTELDMGAAGRRWDHLRPAEAGLGPTEDRGWRPVPKALAHTHRPPLTGLLSGTSRALSSVEPGRQCGRAAGRLPGPRPELPCAHITASEAEGACARTRTHACGPPAGRTELPLPASLHGGQRGPG